MSGQSLALACLATAGAYLLGSLPFGLWMVRWRTGRDVRAGGSGHSGATNTMRQAGWAAGVLVMALDIGKGWLAVWLALRSGGGPVPAALAAAAAVAGHCWPLFAGFRGGMGLATAGGAVLAVYPLGFVAGVGLAAASTLALRHSARGGVATGLLIGPLVWLLSRSVEVALISTLAGLVTALRFAADWRRKYRELWLDRGGPRS